MASPDRKPRGDSKLKRLKEPLQLAIIERMKASKLEEVRAWLRAEFSISTSAGSLSEFWSWWHLRQRVRQGHKQSLDFEEFLRARREKLGLSEDEIIEFGNRFFIETGVATGDAKLYTAIVDRILAKRDGETRAQQRDREITVKEGRLKLLVEKAERADQTKATLQDGRLTPEQKQARLREVYGL